MREMRDPGCDNENVSPTPAQQARAAAIAAEIAALASFALPGTLADRMTRCGHPAAAATPTRPACTAPTTSGPARKNGKTATRILSDDQLADYQPWFDNHRRLRELIAELEELSLAIAEADPRWKLARTGTGGPCPRTARTGTLTCGQPPSRIIPKRDHTQVLIIVESGASAGGSSHRAQISRWICASLAGQRSCEPRGSRASPPPCHYGLATWAGLCG
jgi:hypothetical protein